LDLGTGDGRYAQQLAERQPRTFAIGLDACRENLRERSRLKLPNLLFVISDAQSLPFELRGLVSHIAINFPWGSLLEGLLTGNALLMDGLAGLASDRASLEVRLNAAALQEAGVTLDAGIERISGSLSRLGWRVKAPRHMDTQLLQSFPSTWARRLAHGRDPRAVLIKAWLSMKCA
ncbi:MAG: class I SAM-dependent methyltransferase, partial [Anaerolineae bacterium]